MTRRRWWLFAGLVALAGAWLFPVYWMWATAVRPRAELFAPGLRLLPSEVLWANFAVAWGQFPWARWFLNSLVIAVVSGTFATALDLLAGYAFAKFRFRGREALFIVYLSTLMVPDTVLLVPKFLLTAQLGGMDTFWGVVLPRAGEVFGVFLVRQFLLGLPDELIEAARLEGASEWQVFRRIVLPLSRPVMAVLLLFTLVNRWNDFAWPMVILQDAAARTVPVGLSLLHGQYSADWTAIMAMSLLTVLPVLVLFVAVQRQFVEGVARTGLK